MAFYQEEEEEVFPQNIGRVAMKENHHLDDDDVEYELVFDKATASDYVTLDPVTSELFLQKPLKKLLSTNNNLFFTIKVCAAL